jgi:hypothetical protein
LAQRAEIARHTIEEAAFGLVGLEAVDWGDVDEPLADRQTVWHEILITMQADTWAECFTDDVVLDGSACKARAR